MATTSKFQTILEKFGSVIEKILNAGENIALQEESVITPLLPPAAAAAYVQVVGLIGKNLAAAEPAIAATAGQSAVIRDAKVAAIVGETVIATFARAGVTLAATDVQTFVTAIGTGLSVLQLTGITNTPVVAAS